MPIPHWTNQMTFKYLSQRPSGELAKIIIALAEYFECVDSCRATLQGKIIEIIEDWDFPEQQA
jgi:hypothetical protein